jgi:Leucine-rich repeat (LRR) protein
LQKIECFVFNDFLNFISVSVLDLSNNRLRSLSSSIASLSLLQILDVRNNEFQLVPTVLASERLSKLKTSMNEYVGGVTILLTFIVATNLQLNLMEILAGLFWNGWLTIRKHFDNY